MRRLLTSISLLALPLGASAHGSAPTPADHHASATNDSHSTIGAAASITWNSRGAADSNGLWRIPGVMMGGHALPAEKGSTVDDAILWGSHRLGEQTRVSAKVGVHNDGTTQVELESLALDYTPATHKPVTVSAGLLEPAFSHAAHHHPSLDTFADSTLLADAFWGRSIHDTGVRLAGKPTSNSEIGVEVWNGDFFPATSGEGAQDVYAKLSHERAGWNMEGGVWAMQTDAVKRSDDRYFSTDHSHTPSGVTLTDVRFTGNTQMAGSWFNITAPKQHGIEAALRYEAAQAQSSGTLSDTTRQAAYDSDHLAYAVTPSVSYGKLQLSYRLEKLSLENKLSGNGAQVLADEANLVNDANPKRQTLQLNWQINRNVAARAAYIKDDTLTTSDNRVSVGLTWQDTLYEK
ncbi:hypothetical protein [Thiothrix nivea]|uniref:Porin n=1 Tax=Thiothrix nivea (strain ATCC 35100 / DSM 5205 / JP2) TaxID=870187 RepID=A0A656HEX8_THINJ|nr:hypothetical protein [Thiothrix nivea]EIJ35478.1 hypothetical protein Thini_2952 [Thiothrix nivea DSM 5205]